MMKIKAIDRLPHEKKIDLVVQLVRAQYALDVLLLGLFDRHLRRYFPGIFTKALGDALWALLVFLLIGLVFPKWPARRVFAAALAFSVCIECSQLYHAPWIDAIRGTTPGYLVLGSGFAWGDMMSYLIGCAAGWGLSVLIDRQIRPARASDKIRAYGSKG